VQFKPLGITGGGHVAGGAHLCAFYHMRRELYQLCTSFIRAGLQSHEHCMWITAGPLETQAFASLGDVVSDSHQYVRSGQLEIIPHTQWYLRDGKFDRHTVQERWKAHAKRAEEAGFEGTRVTADLAWLHSPEDWDRFSAYEQEVNASLRERQIIALCAYSTAQISVERMCTMLQCHTHSVRAREGQGWTIAQVQ
jgi:MEDS: MEthanogen/methylotroph, DcmR Sensory domain